MKAIVIPVYNNEGSIPELLEALRRLGARLRGDLAVTFVVDGSPDGSLAALERALPEFGLRATLIAHSRNFGSFVAIRTGLAATEAEHYAVLAADLQEPPELIEEFFRVLEADEADIVLGTRDGRDDPWTSKAAAALFWGFYRRFVIRDMPEGGVDVFACSRTVRDRLLDFVESHTSIIGQLFWVGFRRAVVPYRRLRRKVGRSGWTFAKKLDYLMDSIFAFSDLPIRLLIGLGAIGSLVSLVVGLLAVIFRLAGWTTISGYTALMIGIMFFGALNILGLGIVGAYTHRAYENSKGRPIAVVAARREYGGS